MAAGYSQYDLTPEQREERARCRARGEHYYGPVGRSAGTPARERTAHPYRRWTTSCACGAACWAHTDEDGNTVIESHASGIYGSDVPCERGRA